MRWTWAGRRTHVGGRTDDAGARDRDTTGRDATGRDAGSVAAALGAMVRAGLTPAAAFAELGWPAVADDGRPIGSAPPELVLAARLAHATGAPLGPVLDALGAQARADREAELTRQAALAGPRLSARILALLPVAGIALAVLVDARVLAVLGSALGVALLAVAGALTLAGRLWIRRLVRTAEGAGTARVSPAAIATALRAVMEAGQDVQGALAAVGGALGADDGADRVAAAALTRAARVIGDGGAWADAWEGAPEHVATLARALRLPWSRGASAGPMLAAAADELSYAHRQRATRTAGELGVRLALPLALCLLPAFVVAGVVPLLVALVAGMW